MKKVARIIFRIENVFAIIGTVCAILGGTICAIFIPQIADAIQKQAEAGAQGGAVVTGVGFAFAVGYVVGMFVLALFCIAGIIVTAIGIKKIDTAKSKSDILAIAILNVIFGSRVGAVFLFVSRQSEYEQGQTVIE